MTELQVLLVEDEPADLIAFGRDFPDVFKQNQIDVTIHSCGNFAEAAKFAADPLRRYDLIVSDTYRGPTQNGDADVLQMVNNYRGKRFCPLVVYSSGVKPPTLKESPFVVWADKAKNGDIERAIGAVLKTGVPQIARTMHEELERSAGSFLWGFLEEKWGALCGPGQLVPSVLQRLIRRRAAIQIGDLDHDGQKYSPVLQRCASEYYIYPRLERDYYSLGDILRRKTNPEEFRVVLTPHCHLFKQTNQNEPRADHVLTIKTVPAEQALGDKLTKAKAALEKSVKHKKLGAWARSPADTQAPPEGRHWYLPKFLEIPHLFCDLMQVESIPYASIGPEFDSIATLVAPYAEALQACFVSFYGSVGIPQVKLDSIEDLVG